MLLVDAVYINDGGGKVLLDLLIKELEAANHKVFYLLDERVTGQYPDLDPSRSLYIKNSFKKRLDFYKGSGGQFSRILTFGNVPPPIKLTAKVFTYFHNVLYLNPIKGFSLSSILLRIKVRIISGLSTNTSIWFVQSGLMRDKLASRFKIAKNNILVYPIFQDNLAEDKVSSYTHGDSIKYLYVSDGHPYKNHYNLINAFAQSVRNSTVKKSLTVTISSKYANLCSFIENLRSDGVDIKNLGIISKSDLVLQYQNADVAVYPSLSESFGLGLVEAAQYALPVVAADLPYVHEVIEPTVVFDPASVENITLALSASESFLDRPAKLKIENGLYNMIDIITNNNESDLQQ